MSNNSHEVSAIGRFIRARREATDASAHIETAARRRHVSYLTQRDLAHLIGMSTVVISQIEQGRYPNLSRSILLKISQSLGFSQQQNVYVLGLFDERPAKQFALEPAPAWIHTSINHITHPVVVLNPAFDIVGINEHAKALFGNLSPNFALKRNSALSIFQVPAIREFIVEWEPYAASMVSGMKMNYAMFSGWRDYIDAVAHELCSIDDHFHYLWHQDDPLVKPTFQKQINHTEIGILNVMQILTDIIEVPGLTRIDFTPADDETRGKFERMKRSEATIPNESRP